MPCQGPSQEYAYKEASEFFELLKIQLKEKGIQTDPSKFPYDFGNLKTDQIRNFIELEYFIKEIFWTDACLGF
jgi:hypothetical protein